MFHLCDDLRPQVYLRPNETVRIPFKYQTFSADPAVVAAQVGAEPASELFLVGSVSLGCVLLCSGSVSGSTVQPWQCCIPRQSALVSRRDQQGWVLVLTQPSIP